MVKVRRLIETPACRRYVQINIRDFMMSERELADKYGVPWYPAWLSLGAAVVGLVLGLCVGRTV
jgi:arginase family enzyme